MSSDERDKSREEAPDLEVDLDAAEIDDLEAVTREALAAVEGSGSAPADAADGGEFVEVSRLQQEIADLRDRSIRTLADFDNFRKRAEREREEHKRWAVAEPLRDFLAVMDNLELALAAPAAGEDLRHGVELILRQVQEILRRHGAREIQATGQRFDPALHEAVSREEQPGVAFPTVSEELRRGFVLHDRLLRPAMVKVAVPPEGAPGEDDGPAN
jgi:molecular chaperone GrpE